MCSKICPQYTDSKLPLEKFVFRNERKSEENFGVYRQIVIARSTDKKILDTCQDGGVVTTLLTFALENGKIDGAIVSKVEKTKPFYPKPVLATTSQQILQSAGTRYFYSPNLLALQQAIKQKNIRKLAFVGLPCQITAIRKIQMLPLKKYAEKLKFTIGLLCSGCFSYNELMKTLKEKLGINPEKIKKMNIKGKLIITVKSGKQKKVPLEQIQAFIRKSCKTCTDFSAELADISIGGLGLKGWSLVILRTENGEKLYKEALKRKLLEEKPIQKQKSSLRLLILLSRKAKERLPKDFHKFPD
ncbi:coenzyme F420 hydrogenase subunit beta [Candidatus Bathyarchaeota archaeon]|nr:MAG: coenzyme F420 hydrogenase subunit beta [Candidatus Bathyarchaeota archaeon]